MQIGFYSIQSEHISNAIKYFKKSLSLKRSLSREEQQRWETDGLMRALWHKARDGLGLSLLLVAERQEKQGDFFGALDSCKEAAEITDHPMAHYNVARLALGC